MAHRHTLDPIEDAGLRSTIPQPIQPVAESGGLDEFGHMPLWLTACICKPQFTTGSAQPYQSCSAARPFGRWCPGWSLNEPPGPSSILAYAHKDHAGPVALACTIEPDSSDHVLQELLGPVFFRKLADARSLGGEPTVVLFYKDDTVVIRSTDLKKRNCVFPLRELRVRTVCLCFWSKGEQSISRHKVTQRANSIKNRYSGVVALRPSRARRRSHWLGR